MLRRINPSLPGLVVGIVIYGFVIQIVGVWFVDDKLGYSVGLWYGVAIAIGMAINLATVIYDAVTLYGEAGARGRVIAKSLLRYFAVAILLGVFAYFEIGNLYTAIIGLFGLKISAYMQPFLNKFGNQSSEENTLSLDDENKEKEKEVTM